MLKFTPTFRKKESILSSFGAALDEKFRIPLKVRGKIWNGSGNRLVALTGDMET